MTDQEKKTSTSEEPTKPADASAGGPPKENDDKQPSSGALKELNDKPSVPESDGSSQPPITNGQQDNPADHAIDVAAPDTSDVQELLDAKIEKLQSEVSQVQHLTWWQKMIPGRKRDAQLAEIKSGYDEVLDLIRSMRENLDAQVVGQKKLVEFMSELPDVAEGLRHMGEAATQQKEIMGALKNQMEANAKQNGTIASSMDKFNGTLHSMDDTTRQILQGARQTENSLKSLLERSERRLMIMTSLVIVILIAVGISVVVISKNGGFDRGNAPHTADPQNAPVNEAQPEDDDPSPAANEPEGERAAAEPEGDDAVAPVPVEDEQAPAEVPTAEEADTIEPNAEGDEHPESEGTPPVPESDEDGAAENTPESEGDDTSGSDEEASSPAPNEQEEEVPAAEESPDIDKPIESEGAGTALVGEDSDAGENDVAPESDEAQSEDEVKDDDEESVESSEKPKKKKNWLTRNLFGKSKDDDNKEPPAEEKQKESTEDEDKTSPEGDESDTAAEGATETTLDDISTEGSEAKTPEAASPEAEDTTEDAIQEPGTNAKGAKF